MACIFLHQNDLKLTYMQLGFQHFSGGNTAGPPLKGGEEGWGGKGSRGEIILEMQPEQNPKYATD
jgi:hypothetical protein